jgi:hypothetical protein
MKRKNKIKIRGLRGEGAIGKDLKKKREPVLFELTCKFHFKDLPYSPHIRMSFYITILHDCIKGKFPHNKTVHLLTCVLDGTEKAHSLNGLANLLECLFCGGREPLANRRAKCLYSLPYNRKTKKCFGDTTKTRVGTLLGETCENGRRIRRSVHSRHHKTFWKKLLESVAFLHRESVENFTDAHFKCMRVRMCVKKQ